MVRYIFRYILHLGSGGKDPLRKKPTGKDPFSSGKDPLGGKKTHNSLGNNTLG